MSLILVAEREARYVERIRDALAPEGFTIQTVLAAQDALQSAQRQPPRLALVSTQLPDAGLLLDRFARRAGGPGVVALVPEASGGGLSSGQLDADEVLTKPFSDQALRLAVRRLMSADAQPAGLPGDEPYDEPEAAAADEAPAAPALAPADQLTSADIFGDLVAEVESEIAASAEPAPRPSSREIDRQLEQTLSGLEEILPKPRPPKKRRRPLDDSDVDALLSETLSGLDLSRGAGVPRRRPVPPPAPAPAAPAPAAAPSPVPAEAPTEAPAPLPGVPAAADPRRFGQYTLLDRIAVGGMAEVWKARMTGVEGFQKTVAIKKILSHLTDNEDFVGMFVDEAKLAAQLNHPNIVHIYDLGKIGQHFFIAMEYVHGMNLRGLLNQARVKGKPLPLGLALVIGARLAAALEYAHRKRDAEGRELGLVHRDVSPQNVLLSFEGDIKLCDFGIVKAVTKASTTQMGALKGKLQYMSPEQAWGKSVDARSDVFSLGALLFEMVTGRRLFGGDSEISVLEAVRQCRVTAPRRIDPEIPEEVETVVLQALEQDPDKRYASAGQLRQDLEAILLSMRPSPGQAELTHYVEELARAPELGEPQPEPEPVSSAVFESPAEHEAADAPTPMPAPAAAAAPVLAASAVTQALPVPGAAAAIPAQPPAAEPPAAEESAADATATRAPADGTQTATRLAPPPPRRRTLLWVGLALLLLAAAALAFFLLRGDRGEPAILPPPPRAVEPAAQAEPPASAADETATPPPGTESAAGEAAADSESVDLDSLVEQAMAEKEAELRQQFEQKEEELQRQLEQARTQLAEPPAGGPPPSDPP